MWGILYLLDIDLLGYQVIAADVLPAGGDRDFPVWR
jgi:hypothetical protein